MAISLVIAFIKGWILTFICLATFPLMIVAQYFQMQFIAGAGGESNKVGICLSFENGCHHTDVSIFT